MSNYMDSDRHFAYDAMGRLIHEQGVSRTDGWANANPVSIGYDLAGNMTSLTYPDGRQVAQSFDGAGRLYNVQDTTPGGSGTNYVNVSSYWPNGAMHNETLGTSVTFGVELNNRLQPVAIGSASSLLPSAAPNNNVFNKTLVYGAANNGNIQHIVDNLAPSLTQDYGYDSLNRITYAGRQDRAYSHTYNYDSFGNMLRHDNINGDLNYSIDSATNRLLLNGTDLRYDAAGHMVADPFHSYSYRGDDLLGGMDGGAVSYSYLDGQRTSKVTPSGWTDYVSLNDQPLAEHNQDGTCTDYIYANGMKIAKVDSAKPVFELKGTRTSGTLACGTVNEDSAANSVLSALNPIQPGDMLFVDMLEPVNSSGGGTMGGFFVQLEGQNWAPMDARGVYSHELQTTDGQWQHRSFAIGQQASGHTLTYLGLNMQNSTPIGDWEIEYANLTYVRGGMSYRMPIAADGLSAVPQNNCASTNLTGSTVTLPISTDEGTTFYVGDQIGSTSVEFSSAGWPLWKGDYTPFGQEIIGGNVGSTLGYLEDGAGTHYKFTGKERDSESGLDYFGKRYYESTMGRFMSPDPMIIMKQKFTDPQQWNMYSYTRNNPLRFTDPTGMYVCADSSKCDSKNDKAFQTQLDNLKKAQAGYKAGSAEYDKIGKVLSSYGGAGDTGTAGGKTVSVGFNGAATSSGATTQMLDKATIGVNFSSSFSQHADNNTLGTSVLVGHEGQHVTDGAPTGTARLGSEINAESTSQAIVGGYAAQGLFGINMNPGSNFEVRGIISWDPTMSGNSSSAINGARGAAIRIGIADYKEDMANDKK